MHSTMTDEIHLITRGNFSTDIYPCFCNMKSKDI